MTAVTTFRRRIGDKGSNATGASASRQPKEPQMTQVSSLFVATANVVLACVITLAGFVSVMPQA